MRPGERLALAVLVVIVLIVGGAAGAATYAWHSAGTVRIEVHETRADGTDVSLRMPAILLNAAIALCPTPRTLEDHEAVEALAIVEAVADELVDMPDAVLVDVREADTSVRVEKTNGRLIVRVRDREDRVDVEVPIASVKMLASKLSRVGRVRAA